MRPATRDTLDEWRGRARPEGGYESTCKTPEKLLRSGNFLLAVGARPQGTWMELHENLLLFAVSAVGNPLHPGASELSRRSSTGTLVNWINRRITARASWSKSV